MTTETIPMPAQTSGNDWWMEEDEFDRLIHDLSPEADLPLPSIKDENRAEDHLKSLTYWRGQRALAKLHAQQQRDKTDAWEAAQVAKFQRRCDWHERGLIAFLKASGAKTIKLVNGTLKKITGQIRVEILDEPAFMAWASNHYVTLYRTKTEPDKRAIRKHIETTGEIPPGTDLAPGEVTFKIVLPTEEENGRS